MTSSYKIVVNTQISYLNTKRNNILNFIIDFIRLHIYLGLRVIIIIANKSI